MAKPVTAVMKAPALILMYHRVSENPRDPFWLNVQPGHLREQLAVLRDKAHVVPLDEIAIGGERRVAITLDDGYADNEEIAAPMLSDAGLSATFFVSSWVAERGPDFRFWWDRLEHLLLDDAARCSHAELRLTADLVADVRSTAGRERALAAAGRRFRKLRPAQLERAVDALATQLSVAPGVCDCHRVMTTGQIRHLASDDRFAIGGHTRSHALLAALDATSQRTEVERGRTALEEVIGRPVESFAYPFGDHDAFDRRSVVAVRQSGFHRACTTIPRAVTLFSTRYRLPRFAVRDWTGDEFSRQLERWFAGLGTETTHS